MKLIFNGPDNGPLFVFAHGAGAPADSTFMTTIALGLATKGIRVARFNFPYMQQRVDNGTRRPPERAPKLIAQFATLLNQLECPMVIGGKSMGGRMATLLLAQLASDELDLDLPNLKEVGTKLNKQVKGVACLGFPFHPAAQPEKLRTEHFPLIKQPVLIIQGERDKLGSHSDVTGYQLPSTIDWLWLNDGDHDLKPRVKSGYNHQEHLEQAIDKLALFIKIQLESEVSPQTYHIKH